VLQTHQFAKPEMLAVREQECAVAHWAFFLTGCTSDLQQKVDNSTEILDQIQY